MGNTRFMNGSRDSATNHTRSVAAEFIRLEMQKKGKLPAQMRYQMILKRRLAESRDKAGMKPKTFGIPGSKAVVKERSKRAEQALKEMAAKKAAKEAKALRQMVIVQPRNYSNGNINKKGQIFDIAGNMIGKVNTKNGKMATNGGWSIGKYKAKSMFTDMMIQDAINKYSPYYINLRKMQAMQAAGGDNYGVWGAPIAAPEVVDVNSHMAMHGGGYQPPSHNQAPPGLTLDMHGRYLDMQGRFVDSNGHQVSEGEAYGIHMAGPRQNIGSTAWGATSDNVWGTMTDNVWGKSTDNIWGGNSSDVWGGISASNPWGSHAKTVRIWNSGSGENYIKPILNRIAALLGFNTKSMSQRAGAINSARQSAGPRASSAVRSTPSFARSSSARSSAPAPRSAPSGGGRR